MVSYEFLVDSRGCCVPSTSLACQYCTLPLSLVRIFQRRFSGLTRLIGSIPQQHVTEPFEHLDLLHQLIMIVEGMPHVIHQPQAQLLRFLRVLLIIIVIIRRDNVQYVVAHVDPIGQHFRSLWLKQPATKVEGEGEEGSPILATFLLHQEAAVQVIDLDDAAAIGAAWQSLQGRLGGVGVTVRSSSCDSKGVTSQAGREIAPLEGNLGITDIDWSICSRNQASSISAGDGHSEIGFV